MAKTSTPPGPSKTISTNEAAALAGVDPKTILNWIKRGIIKARKKGFGPTSAYVIDRAEFMKKLSERNL